jgi:polysaccharide biosynthesis protein VpsQ
MWRWLSLVFGAFLVFIIVSAGMDSLPPVLRQVYDFPLGDKISHFVLIGFFTFLLNMALAPRMVQIAGKYVLLGTVIVFVLVTLEEFSQIFLVERNFELLDLAANYLGIFAADRIVWRWKCCAV